jgi:glycerol-3-phosphate cytidylyltransferase
MKFVYTYGVFDLLHYGHIKCLKRAKKIAEVNGAKLIVGIFTDDVAESFKRKPVMSESERYTNIEELEIADLIIFQYSKTPLYEVKNAQKLGFECIMIIKGYGADWFDYGDMMKNLENNNIKCELLPYTVGISTSEIIQRIKNRDDL